ncbi:MAG TPA: NlpC/P60 family protein [Kofleriaceae bacterium]|nr:NlpC/P60 family protein [Kofleriaceae bacterium]
MNLRVARIVVVVGVLVGALAVAPLAANGSPIDDKRAQAAQIQAQINANGDKIDALSEQYNGAVYKLQQIDQQISDSQTRLQAAQSQYDKVRHEVDVRAAEIYIGAGSDNPLAAIDVQNINDLAARSKYAAAATSRDNDLMDRLNASKDQLKTQRDQLERDHAKAQSEKDRLASAKAQLVSANAKQQALLKQTNQDLNNLVAQYKRQAAAAQAAAQRQASQQSNGGGGGGSSAGVSVSVGPIPPTSPRAMIAVNFALAQVGKPYVYATSGPDTYDCSGLTAASWEHAGVSMPHYSGAQYQMFPHVPLSAIQPGDLLFRGPGGSQHVEIYIGNGMVVTAPHTGDFVKVAPMGNVLPMAARPG